jgi:hypothetical protein
VADFIRDFQRRIAQLFTDKSVIAKFTIDLSKEGLRLAQAVTVED